VARKENIARTVNLEACLGYMVGEIAEPAYDYYIEGFGAFRECVVKDPEGEPYLHRWCMGCYCWLHRVTHQYYSSRYSDVGLLKRSFF
jgi:hypothetical protein